MHVTPIEAPCGARVTDLDLRHELAAGLIADIRQAWLQYHVLVFPDQDLDVDDLARFTLYLGNFGEDPFFNPIKEHNNIAAIRRDADGKTSMFAENWHTCLLYKSPSPPD